MPTVNGSSTLRPHKAAQNQQHVTVIGDCLLQGDRGIHLLTQFINKGGLLPVGAQTKEAAEAEPKLVHYPQLLFHVNTNDTARGNMDSIKRDYRALQAVVKGIGSQVWLLQSYR